VLDCGKVCTAYKKKKTRETRERLIKFTAVRLGARRKMMRVLERLSDAKRRSSAAARECHDVDYGWRTQVLPLSLSRKDNGRKVSAAVVVGTDPIGGKGCRSSNERA